MKEIPNNHPYWFIADILRNNPLVATLNFSHYRYIPQSIVDERKTITIARDSFLSPNWMSEFISNTPSERELSLHSNMTLYSGIELHLPMVDMSTASRAHLGKLQALIEHTGFGQFEWFSSGRSFHGYGRSLLPQEDWVKLMGALLLSNQKGMVPIVDPRWIGHRLLGGFSALRWTKNTMYYVDFPTYVLPY